jgi:deoxyribodipyrimidine photo-lyase
MPDALCWIRRDLRLHDHRALARATEAHGRVAVVFVYDTRILSDLPDRDDRRLNFIHRSLEEVDEALRRHGSRLLTVVGDPVEDIPRLAARLGVEAVFANRDDDPYALERDATVARILQSDGRRLETDKDCVVFERQEVLNQSGRPFTVFTPYSKAWFAKFRAVDAAEETPRPAAFWPEASLPATVVGNRTLGEVGFQPTELWLEPGASGGQARLERFLEQIDGYADRRDLPGIEGTSGLSVHLRHGTVSVRECVRAVAGLEGRGSTKWWTELVWREFYHMVLANFPHVATRPFRSEFGGARWPGDPAHFDAWCEGRTGYPIVDAAMRCLRQTGWMHNRLRMVTAMFLTKDLLLDYRLGEAWFARWLLDFELASNSGGWQWSASTGVDAQPWFRIFNPVLQSRKFDPDGAFVRRWCPEFSGFSNEAVHWPADAGPFEQIEAGCVVGHDYPEPIVDHSVQREKALAFLESVAKPGAAV